MGIWNDRIRNTLSPQSFEEIDIHFGYHPTTDNNGDINNWGSLGLNYTFNKMIDYIMKALILIEII